MPAQDHAQQRASWLPAQTTHHLQPSLSHPVSSWLITHRFRSPFSICKPIFFGIIALVPGTFTLFYVYKYGIPTQDFLVLIYYLVESNV